MKVFLAIMLFCGAVFSKNIELTEDNIVVIRNEINDRTVTKAQLDLITQVAKRGSKTYTIYLVLDTPGGSIDAGLNFIEFAKTVKNLETVTLFAASMGSAIVEALPGKRNIIETGILMFHRAYGGVEGQFEDGELESRLNFYKGMVRAMESTNSSRMSMSLDAYKAKVKDELWISGINSVKDKAADEIVSLTCSSELLKSSSIETFLIMGMFEVDVKFNGCPLIKMGQVVDPKNKLKYQEYRKKSLKGVLK